MHCDIPDVNLMFMVKRGNFVVHTYSKPRPKITETPSLFCHVIFNVQMTCCGSRKMAMSDTSWMVAEGT